MGLSQDNFKTNEQLKSKIIHRYCDLNQSFNTELSILLK